MTHADIIRELETLAPLSMQESYDNCGLLVGEKLIETTGVLVCLDCTEQVVNEAINIGCNLIVAHHPIIFGKLRKLTGSGYVERTVMNALRHHISIYAIHTNLDNMWDGVNHEMANRLGLQQTRILRPFDARLLKLNVFVPKTHTESVRQALFDAGAGDIGNYSECSFSCEGQGTFKGNEHAQPVIGEVGVRHTEPETRLEVILPDYRKQSVLQAMVNAHPYEEVAYDLFRMENTWHNAGAGRIGELPHPIPTMDFLKVLKQIFSSESVKYTSPHVEYVKRIAICGGAGSFLLHDAIRNKADVFVTGDFKHHDFFEADGQIIVADIGHYESEQFTIDLLAEYLNVKFPNFAVRKSEIVTNPIKSI